MSFYICHRYRVCLVDHVDLICSLYSWSEGFESSSVATLPLGFNCGFIFAGFSLPCLLATAILDSFSLFYLPNSSVQLSVTL